MVHSLSKKKSQNEKQEQRICGLSSLKKLAKTAFFKIYFIIDLPLSVICYFTTQRNSNKSKKS
jgi:hypothetical protein